MRKALIVILLLAASALFAAESKHYVLNYKRLSTSTVGITCANGADPTGTKIGDMVIISCGK